MIRSIIVIGALATGVGCGVMTGPSKTVVRTGTFGVINSVYSLDEFEGDVDATLTWTPPAEGPQPIGELYSAIAGIPDRVTARSPTTASPPIMLRLSGTHFVVRCRNCNVVSPPVPFTVTLTGR